MEINNHKKISKCLQSSLQKHKFVFYRVKDVQTCEHLIFLTYKFLQKP